MPKVSNDNTPDSSLATGPTMNVRSMPLSPYPGHGEVGHQ